MNSYMLKNVMYEMTVMIGARNLLVERIEGSVLFSPSCCRGLCHVTSTTTGHDGHS
jgi:hypothetical protein